MKIIRFLTDTGDVRFGRDYQSGRARLLEGDLFDGLRETDGDAVVARLLAPVVPRAIFCIGLNFRLHAGEFGADLPEHPIVFMKNPASVSHPGGPIVLPGSCIDPPQVDYEVELVVVIGRAAKNVKAADALDHVLGYTIGNDVSARRWQKHGGGGQWVRGKSFDTFCPLGPALVTADEIPDPQNLRLTCRLNGELMQDGNTADMIFPVARLVEFLSEDTTLLPGTVIMTGTPSGVGFVRTPPVWLMPGDSISMTIDPIGVLNNTVATDSSRH